VIARSAESVEDGLDVCTRLHGDDSQLVLFVDPDEEGLVVVVEDASAIGPVSVQAAGLKEAVAFLKEEVVFNELLSLGLGKIV
jgi:hypothetical protein